VRARGLRGSSRSTYRKGGGSRSADVQYGGKKSGANCSEKRDGQRKKDSPLVWGRINPLKKGSPSDGGGAKFEVTGKAGRVLFNSAVLRLKTSLGGPLQEKKGRKIGRQCRRDSGVLLC